ncbi:quaternary ammonium compound-resistance protein SugE [Haloactinospora alba]|uniref:Quaternary ammonium compound-resistance protein SugE n=1 Tax=Haloactinospora alba TaxID=405555 RepID=A0A543NNE7_9ACTN|nr:multidrug efflux SMR transporter [Haloactinospora alba]TQN33317.1 quaternary ammonium compound-resistance protein SugE [Haloactinospora alba]
MTTSPNQPDHATHKSSPRQTRAWAILLIAGIFEIGYAVSTGGSEGFTNVPWSISAAVFFFLTVFTLSVALKVIDVGLGYAVWVGIGASGAAIVSAFLFDEPLTPLRLFWIGMIIVGTIILKLTESSEQGEISEATEQLAESDNRA